MDCIDNLVLLSHKLKYKCGSCSKIYSWKEIELNTFRAWNQKQRELDRAAHKTSKKIKIVRRGLR